MKFAAILAIAIAILPIDQASGQGLTLTGVGGGSTSGGPPPAPYTGPGDIQAYSEFWGLRAYSSAIALAGTALINVRRASDNTALDIHSTTSGALDTGAAQAFAGVDAVCTGAIVTTTLTLAGCASGAPHVSDQVNGVGVTAGTIITNIGSCGSGTGTCTVNKSQTVASTTLTMPVALFITTMYGQTGTGHAMAQAVGANQPQILFSGGTSGSLPFGYFNGSGFLGFTQPTGQVVPYTVSYVGVHFSSGPGGYIFSSNTQMGDILTTNAAQIYAGTLQSITATDDVWHAEQSVYNPVGQSIMYLDGVSNLIGSPGGATIGNGTSMGVYSTFNAAFLGGGINEVGYITGVITSTTAGLLNTNQHAYWGF